MMPNGRSIVERQPGADTANMLVLKMRSTITGSSCSRLRRSRTCLASGPNSAPAATTLFRRCDAGQGIPQSTRSTSGSAQSQSPADADAVGNSPPIEPRKKDVQPAVEIGADMTGVARDLPHLCCVRPPIPSGRSGVLPTAAPHTLVTYHLYVDRIDAYRVWHRKVAMAIPCHMGPRKAKITGRVMSTR